MSDRVRLAREIAARTEPRFIEIKSESRRRIRASLLAEIPRQRGGGRVPFTEVELTAMRGEQKVPASDRGLSLKERTLSSASVSDFI